MNKNLIAVIVLFLLLAVVAAGLFFTMSRAPEATETTAAPPPTTTTPATQPVTVPAAAASTQPSATTTPSTVSPAADLEAVEATVAGYLQAKQRRDFSQAKPYLTPEYAATFNQEAFAGTSNPHWGRYEILGSPVAAADGQSYTVSARVYQEYTGEGEIGYSDDTFVVSEVGGGQYLISDVTIGSYVSLR